MLNLKANSKIILILFFFISLIVVLSGCGIQTAPPIINGTVYGYVALSDGTSKDLTGYTPIPGATVTIVDADGVTHTVITDENGYYFFDNLNININTIITITKETEEGIQIFKDVVPLAVPSEENYDAGIADALSTGLALVVEGLIQAGWTQEEIDLEEITNHILFDDLGEYIQQAQNNNQGLTEAIIVTTVDKIINNPANLPSPPPASDNANLSKLVVSVGILDPVFSSDVIEYTVTVDNSITGITLTPTKAESHAEIKVNGNPVVSDQSSSEISLNPGPNTVTIVVTAENGTTKNYTITVHRTLAITASTGSNGTIVPTGTVQVNYGTNKSFAITAATNYHIAQIKVDGSPIDLTKQRTRIPAPTNQPKTHTYTFTDVTINHTIEATFAIDTFTLTMSKIGTGTGTTTPTAGVHTYNYGASVTISASPDATSTFTGWSGDASGTSNVNLSMTENKSVTATFTLKSYTVTASAGSNGSIDPSGATTVNHGSDQSFTIAAATNYHIEDVLVDGSSVGAVSSYGFTNVTDNHTIEATFAINSYTVTFDKNGGDTEADPTTKPATHGGNVGTLPTAPTRTGYTFTSWNTEAGGSGTEFTATTVVTANLTVYAQWTINSYTVTFDSQGGSAVSSQAVNHGGKATEPTAPTKTGYTFGGWYEESGCTNVWSFSTDTVTADVTLYAKWTINSYTVTFDKNGGDTEADPTTKPATHGGNVGTLPTAPTRTGYTFTSWNTEAGGSGTEFTATTAVTANLTVYAQWTSTTTGNISGTVKSASTGSGLSGATVTILETSIASTTTDGSGNYSFSNVPVGDHNVKASATGYMDETVSVTVQEDQTATGNIVLVPTIASGQMRIVLTWGTTGDLDSYLWNPSGEKLYYGNKIISDASLDVDNTAGYGPETVTITTLNNGVYTYKVNDCGLCMMDFFFDDPFGDCYTITTCDAVVKLYDSNGLVNTFTPPDVISSSGAYWTVFTITVDGENVTVTTINTID